MQELDTQSVDIALHVRMNLIAMIDSSVYIELSFQCTKKKVRRPLSRVVSFANMLMESPGKALHVSNWLIKLCCIIVYYLLSYFISDQSA